MSFRSRIQWFVDATVTGLPSYPLFKMLGDLAWTPQNFILYKSAWYLRTNDVLKIVEHMHWFLDLLTPIPLKCVFCWHYNTRMATLKLNLPFRQSCLGKKTILYLGPNTWNNLAAETKFRRSVNTFKHDIKKLFFDKLKKQNDDIFFYY